MKMSISQAFIQVICLHSLAIKVSAGMSIGNESLKIENLFLKMMVWTMLRSQADDRPFHIGGISL